MLEGQCGVSRGHQASGLAFLLNWKEPGDPQPRQPPGLGPAQVEAPQARAGVSQGCPGALPIGGRAGQELQPLGGGGSSLHTVGESHVPQASPRGSSWWCRAALCTAQPAGPRAAPPCGARSTPGPATWLRAFWWGGERVSSRCGANTWGPQCCGREAPGSRGAWARWLWLEQGFWKSWKDPLGHFSAQGLLTAPGRELWTLTGMGRAHLFLGNGQG